jgi:uncharacterized protein YdhG (YjbR/CyaY superfamily)
MSGWGCGWRSDPAHQSRKRQVERRRGQVLRRCDQLDVHETRAEPVGGRQTAVGPRRKRIHMAIGIVAFSFTHIRGMRTGGAGRARRGYHRVVKKRTAATIDDYLAGVSGERRAALMKLRKTIRAIAPRAEECISYAMPAFRLDGKVIAGFLATKRGCSYFPFSGRTLRTLAKEVAGYSQTKGSLHFDPSAPLPAALVRKLIKTRIAED